MKPGKSVENVQTIFEISSGNLTFIKKYIYLKNLTDFRNTVETDMNLRLGKVQAGIWDIGRLESGITTRKCGIQ